MKFENIMIGADPELFLVDNNGHLKSAIGLIGGSKWEPRKLDELGHAVQEDNVAVEFNIAPAKTKEDFKKSISYVLGYLSDFVGKQQLLLNIIPAAMFPDSELNCQKAMEFGCEPDYNVWLKTENQKPELPKELQNLRSCGGHLHISWDKSKDTGKDTDFPWTDDISKVESLVKAMDVFVGCPSILYDGDLMRRKLYGKAGAFRFKPYGVEYRSLSNFWLRESTLVDWVYDQTLHAIDYINSGGEIAEGHKELINDCINNGNEASFLKLQQYYPV